MAVENGKVRPFQLYKGKFHQGLAYENHLANMYFKQPYYASTMVEKMFETTFGDDILSHVNQFPVHKVSERTYRWVGIGMTDKNIALQSAWEDAAGTIPVGTTTEYIGANGTVFFMDFNEKWFGSKQEIVGMKPDLYRIWILEEPSMTGSGYYRYRVQLVGSDGIYIPKEELKAGTRWSGDGGLVANEMSRDGYEPTFTSPFEFENRLTQFRTKLRIPGGMYHEGKFSDVYMFKFVDNDGGEHKVWFDAFWYNFLKMNRVDKAKKFLYSKSNKLADGSTRNVDPQTGFNAEEGSGMYEMMSAGNIHPFYPGGLTADYLTKVILDASITKVPEDKRQVTVLAGEYGLMDLHKMCRNDLINTQLLPAYMGDTTGRAYKWTAPNQLQVNYGQIVGFANLNGVVVKFMHAPHKDNPIRHKLLYEKGGRASSYEYDILDFGTTNGRPNIQRVEYEGEPDVYAIKVGIRSKFAGRGSEKLPVQVSTETDMDEIHHMAWVGAIIWNPTKIIRMIPAVLYR
jgi:hypothetical protein